MSRLAVVASRVAQRAHRATQAPFIRPNFRPVAGVKHLAGHSVMPTFVVSLRLPDAYDEEFIALIPSHRAFINRLLAEKVVEVYAISSDRSRGWVTINGDDAAAVRAVVEQFPLYRYLHSVEIDELFIFGSAASRFPHISLN